MTQPSITALRTMSSEKRMYWLQRLAKTTDTLAKRGRKRTLKNIQFASAKTDPNERFTLANRVPTLHRPLAEGRT
jgi:hypothetical protein